MMFRRVSPTFVSLSVCLVVSFADLAAAEIVVTTCGQIVTRPARLDADLDCSSHVGSAVFLQRTTLNLNGHKIIGSVRDENVPYSGVAVACVMPDASFAGGLRQVRCTVLGPGEITSAEETGIRAQNARVRGATITGNQAFGVAATGRVRLIDTLVSDNGATGVVVVGQGRSLLRRSTLRQNDGSGVDFNSNSGGLTIDDSEITLNASHGIYYPATGQLKIRGSTVSDNVLDPSSPYCTFATWGGEVGCADITSYGPVSLKQTTCGSSFAPWTGEPLGICAND